MKNRKFLMFLSKLSKTTFNDEKREKKCRNE